MPSPGAAPELELIGIRKLFSGIEVLHGVNLDLRAGEVHALIGQNGAGKSTLIKILAGVHRDYSGQIRLRGRPVRFRGPRDAQQQGIAVIHQELALVPGLSVAENVFLGREPVSRLGWLRGATLRRAAAEVIHGRLGIELDVAARVADLPLAAQQLVEIARALSQRVAILVMDEPSSALSDADAARLFAIVRQLRAGGAAIILTTHKLDEIYALADRVTVLRDGACVGTTRPAELPPTELIRWMVGRTVEPLRPARHVPPGPERLRVTDLSLREAVRPRWIVRGASFSVRAGEIVGLAGLLGSGASELLGAIYGRYGRAARGTIHVNGRRLSDPTPRRALHRGLALLTNDRQATGLVLPMSVLHNLSLAALKSCTRRGLLSRRREQERCLPLVERLRVRAPSLTAEIATLSGGNQQKTLFARWLLTNPQVLLLDEPTRGIDVATKADIYQLLHELTARGLGVVLTASELPELLALADRTLVLHRGQIVAELDRAQATPQRVLLAALGGTPPPG